MSAISAPSRARRLGDAVGDRAVGEHARDQDLPAGEEPHAFDYTGRLRVFLILLAVFSALATGCGEVWNDPYPAAERGKSILYASFVARPKHLDPVQSYTEDEAQFTQQVYEPLLQYHYLKRPYELIPLTAVEIPKPRSIEGGKFTVYEVRIKPGIRYQPHPAFVPENLKLEGTRIDRLKSPYQLPTGTRELVADDYIYQIKRLAHPRLHSPIYGLMAEYIVGMADFAKRLKSADAKQGWLDLRSYGLKGVERVDSHTFRVTLNGAYPQFVYWLAMPFFAPVPWEADQFFSQPGMEQKNFTLDWWPVGTGAYMLTENNPNARMVLERNPNFHGEVYPGEGEPEDAGTGLLADAGKPLPFIEKLVFSREKEGDSILEQVPAGVLRHLGHRLGPVRPGGSRVDRGRHQRHARDGGKGHPPLHIGRDDDRIHRVQLARSGRRRAEGRRAGAARSQAAARHLDRVRRRGADLDLRQRPRHCGAGTDRAGDLRLPRGPGRHQPDRLRLGRRQARAQVDRGGAAAARRGRLPGRSRREDRPAPASSTSTRWCAARATRPRSTGCAASSRSSRSSS